VVVVVAVAVMAVAVAVVAVAVVGLYTPNTANPPGSSATILKHKKIHNT
jgi:hypothetical protein